MFEQVESEKYSILTCLSFLIMLQIMILRHLPYSLAICLLHNESVLNQIPPDTIPHIDGDLLVPLIKHITNLFRIFPNLLFKHSLT